MPKIILILPVPGILSKKLSFMAPDSFILSVIAPDVVIVLLSFLKMSFTVSF